MVSLMAALREIDRHQDQAQLLALQDYEIKPVQFESIQAAPGYDYFDAAAFFRDLPNATPVISEKIQSIVCGVKDSMARAVADFCLDFGEPPVLESPMPATVAAEFDRILDAPKPETFYNSAHRSNDVAVSFESGTIGIDSGAFDLPDTTLDPRNGGNYQTEIATLQPALDAVQAVQNWVPTPIQSAATDEYNELTAGRTDAGPEK